MVIFLYGIVRKRNDGELLPVDLKKWMRILIMKRGRMNLILYVFFFVVFDIYTIHGSSFFLFFRRTEK